MVKKITIYDLAETLGISPGTVSRGLNNHPAISDKTKRLIKDKASELGYRSNKFAANLSKQKSNTLGVIVPRLNSYFMSTVLSGIEKTANDAGYTLIISQSLELMKKEIVNSSVLLNSGVDALLVSLAYDTDQYDHFREFTDRKIPMLFFDRVVDMPGCSNIIIDNRQAGFDATEHLIEQQCKRIMYVGGNLKRNVYANRLQGYRDAMEKYQLPVTKNMVIESDLHPEHAVEIVKKITSSSNQVDGLFVANDTFAAHCMKELKNAGCEIPKDIKIVGFNNDLISNVITPTLTTIDYPGYEMGVMAGQSIINHLNGSLNLNPANTIILRHKLLIRESSVSKT